MLNKIIEAVRNMVERGKDWIETRQLIKETEQKIVEDMIRFYQTYED